MPRRICLFLSLTLLLAACPKPQVVVPPPPPDPPLAPVPLTPPPQPRPPKVALVLGGGGARGFAHVGVLRVLEQEKVPIDLIVGTSVGSLIGALYADNPDTFQLEWAAFELDADDLLDFSLFSVSKGPVKGEAVKKFVREHVRARKLEDLKIPLIVVATDLNTGERIDLEEGSVEEAVRASVSIPGVFVPTQLGGRTLVDGGLVSNIAVDVARENGAEVVIAVNITENVTDYELENLAAIIVQSINIMMGRMAAEQLRQADVVIQPDVLTVGTFEFEKKKQCMLAGIESTRAAVPAIQKAIADWRPPVEGPALPPEHEDGSPSEPAPTPTATAPTFTTPPAAANP